MADVILVRMLRSYRCWNAGETAGFRPDVAQTLVSKGAAVYVKEKPSVEVSQDEVEELANALEEDEQQEAVAEVFKKGRHFYLRHDGQESGPFTKKHLTNLGYEV